MVESLTSGINPKRLFLGSCFALIATSVAFAMVGAVMGPLKEVFILTNEQIGWIGGAGLWGFPITIMILGPLVDIIGMRLLLRVSLLFHFTGTLLMITANGFWMLFGGAMIIAMGNGIVEAVCNPLVATAYPDRKTEMLNKFHVWFPGGIVIGGLIAYVFGLIGLNWQVTLAIILIPASIYGVIFTGQLFPATESKQIGVSFGQMFKETLFRPLFVVLAFSIVFTASLELGPNRWIPAVLTSAGMPGILVLVWISLIMAVLRYFAGPLVQRFKPTGLLLGSALFGGLGLFWLSYADTFLQAIVASTVFAVGVCYCWPTLLGITSERVPKGGPMALAWMSGVGMLTVGLITSPLMGWVADKQSHQRLPFQQTLLLMDQGKTVLNSAVADAPVSRQIAIRGTLALIDDVLGSATEESLPEITTANALRSLINIDPTSPVAKQAQALLAPAENFGGKRSFRFLAPFSLIPILIFGFIYFRDRRRGGYQVEKL
ncbi:MFS transporter [candidate division KSB1 bacterium]|nr:MFS transporter [candidate division KSB1 bacterium]